MAAHDDKRAEALKRRQASFQASRNIRIENHLRKASADPDMREFLWWLLTIGKVSHQPFTSNALTTAFQCGELNVGQQVLARIIEVDPAIYVQMQQEQNDEYQNRVTNAGVLDGTGGQSGSYDHPDASGDDD